MTPSATATVNYHLRLCLLPQLPHAAPPQSQLWPPSVAIHSMMCMWPALAAAPHGAVRNDDYYWLRDDTRKSPEMLAVLNAENAYADAMLISSKPTADKLYAEITGRIKQDDSSVPFLRKGYWYYTRFETGKDYAIIARRKGSMDAP